MNRETTDRKYVVTTPRIVLVLVAIFLASNILSDSLRGQGLDVGFGPFGIGVASPGIGIDDRTDASLLAPDGSIYIAGKTDFGGGGDNILIVRLDANGMIDTSFGGFGGAPDGFVVTDNQLRDDFAYGIDLTDEGKILVLAYSKINLADQNLILLRYNPDGSLDEEFAQNGRITLDIDLSLTHPIGDTYRTGMEIVDDRIVVWTYDRVHRYEMTGSVDLTFGVDGSVSFPELLNANPRATDADFVDGKMYFGFINSVFLALDQNGALDNSFGVNGIMNAPPGVPSGVNAFTVHNGMITVGASDPSVYRIDFNGDLDGNFSIDGVVDLELSYGFGEIRDIILQPYGLITVSVLGFDFSAVRLNDTGELDTTFGNKSGWMRYQPFGLVPYDAHSLFGYANGKVLMIGNVYQQSLQSELLVIRTTGFPKPTTRFIEGIGNQLTIPGTGGNDHFQIVQTGPNVLVNYPDLPGGEFEFAGINSIVVDSDSGNDRIEYRITSTAQWNPDAIKIDTGSGDDDVIFHLIGELDYGSPVFDLGLGVDRLYAFVDNDSECSPNALSYVDGRIENLLQADAIPVTHVKSPVNADERQYLHWHLFDEDRTTNSPSQWTFIKPCQSGEKGLKILIE